MPVDFESLVLLPILETFGEPARYTPPGETESIDLKKPGVKFDEAHKFVVTGEEGIQLSTTAPAALVRLADFPAGEPSQGGTLFLVDRERNFSVVDVQPTGTGGAILPLHEV